jgi:SAM-dependent methyltransferase
MWYTLGELLEKVLALLGWGIYPLARAQGVRVESAFEHNTPERTDALFRDPKVLRRYLSPARLRYYKGLIHLLPLEAYHQRSVADVGCGPGYFLLLLYRELTAKGYQPTKMFGFDYSLAALEIARQIFPRAEYRYMDIYTPFEEQFDIVVCIDVLEHLLYPDRALRNLIQMVAPQGLLLLAVPNGRYDFFAGHINFWSPESWRVFLEMTCPELKIQTGLTSNGRLAGEGRVNYALIRKCN